MVQSLEGGKARSTGWPGFVRINGLGEGKEVSVRCVRKRLLKENNGWGT